MIADVLREIAAEMHVEAYVSDRSDMDAWADRLEEIATRTEDDILLACEWSDYRKETVSSAHMVTAHRAFKAGWAAACGYTFEPGPLR